MKNSLVKTWGRFVYNSNKIFFPDFKNDFYLANEKKFCEPNGPAEFFAYCISLNFFFELTIGFLRVLDLNFITIIHYCIPGILLGCLWSSTLLIIPKFLLFKDTKKYINQNNSSNSEKIMYIIYVIGLYVFPIINLIRETLIIKSVNERSFPLALNEIYFYNGVNSLKISFITIILYYLVNHFKINIDNFISTIKQKINIYKKTINITPLKPYVHRKDWRVSGKENMEEKELSKILD